MSQITSALWRRYTSVLAFLQRHPFINFLMMDVFFLAFGVTSFNLVMYLRANLDLYWEHGWVVISDGAVRQFAELFVMSVLALLFYLGFKVCERLLVDKLTSAKCEK